MRLQARARASGSRSPHARLAASAAAPPAPRLAGRPRSPALAKSGRRSAAESGSSARTSQSAARRSRPIERNASASARRSSAAREMPERSQRSRTLVKGVVARRDELRRVRLAKALDLAKAEADGVGGADGGGLVSVAGVKGSQLAPSPPCGGGLGRGLARGRTKWRAAIPLPQPLPARGRGGARLPARGEGVLLILQRRVPIRKIDVHLAHLHAVLAGVADELGGGVEAHRLGVQQARRRRRRGSGTSSRRRRRRGARSSRRGFPESRIRQNPRSG